MQQPPKTKIPPNLQMVKRKIKRKTKQPRTTRVNQPRERNEKPVNLTVSSERAYSNKLSQLYSPFVVPRNHLIHLSYLSGFERLLGLYNPRTIFISSQSNWLSHYAVCVWMIQWMKLLIRLLSCVYMNDKHNRFSRFHSRFTRSRYFLRFRLLTCWGVVRSEREGLKFLLTLSLLRSLHFIVVRFSEELNFLRWEIVFENYFLEFTFCFCEIMETVRVEQFSLSLPRSLRELVTSKFNARQRVIFA